MKKINFFHIPKNAGQSIGEIIKNYLPNMVYHNHFIDPFLYEPDYSMVVLRDPIDRFVSAFYYSKQYYPTCKLSLRTDIITPSDLIQSLINDNNEDYLLSTTHHNIGNTKLKNSWVWTPQSLWFNNPKYILSHNNLCEDFKNFLIETDQPVVDLPHVNKSKKPDYYLTLEEISYLHNKYKSDYIIIEKIKSNYI